MDGQPPSSDIHATLGRPDRADARGGRTFVPSPSGPRIDVRGHGGQPRLTVVIVGNSRRRTSSGARSRMKDQLIVSFVQGWPAAFRSTVVAEGVRNMLPDRQAAELTHSPSLWRSALRSDRPMHPGDHFVARCSPIRLSPSTRERLPSDGRRRSDPGADPRRRRLPQARRRRRRRARAQPSRHPLHPPPGPAVRLRAEPLARLLGRAGGSDVCRRPAQQPRLAGVRGRGPAPGLGGLRGGPREVAVQDPEEFDAIRPIGPSVEYRYYGDIEALQQAIRQTIMKGAAPPK